MTTATKSISEILDSEILKVKAVAATSNDPAHKALLIALEDKKVSELIAAKEKNFEFRGLKFKPSEIPGCLLILFLIEPPQGRMILIPENFIALVDTHAESVIFIRDHLDSNGHRSPFMPRIISSEDSTMSLMGDGMMGWGRSNTGIRLNGDGYLGWGHRLGASKTLTGDGDVGWFGAGKTFMGDGYMGWGRQTQHDIDPGFSPIPLWSPKITSLVQQGNSVLIEAKTRVPGGCYFAGEPYVSLPPGAEVQLPEQISVILPITEVRNQICTKEIKTLHYAASIATNESKNRIVMFTVMDGRVMGWDAAPLGAFSNF